jgi:hypothetical protein
MTAQREERMIGLHGRSRHENRRGTAAARAAERLSKNLNRLDNFQVCMRFAAEGWGTPMSAVGR